MADDLCPCGTGLAYGACCGPWHAGGEAPTAEALMRSRYSAFVRRNAPYLIRTLHPLARGAADVRELRQAFALTWCGLEVLEVRDGCVDDREGVVHFKARYRGPAGEAVLEERSRFQRIAGIWIYRDGRG